MRKTAKKNNLNFLCKLVKNGQVIQRVETKSKRRFTTFLRTINWKDGHLKVYLRVSYGLALSNRGKLENFYNDGYYNTKEDLFATFNAFTEQSLLRDFRKEVKKK